MERRIRKILLTLAILLIVLLFVFTIINTINRNKLKYKSVHELDNILGYTNSLIDIYKGNIPAYKITNKIQIAFETYLPSISDNIIGKQENDLEKYFQEDSERIKMNLGITKKEDFIQFAKSIQDLGCNLNEFTKLTYIEDSYQKIDNKEIILINVAYKNEKELKCKVQIVQKESNINLKFEAIN